MRPTFARYCCGQTMELSKRLPDGNEIVTCCQCAKDEEISSSGCAVPRAAQLVIPPTSDLMAEIGTGLPVELQALFK